jgi:hypothetical protein
VLFAAEIPNDSGILDWLGYVVHGDKSNLANSNVADVANSIINMIGTGVTIIVIILSPALSRRFGKKAVAVGGFALAALGSLSFYLLAPTNVTGMIILTVSIAMHAPRFSGFGRCCRWVDFSEEDGSSLTGSSLPHWLCYWRSWPGFVFFL